MSAWGLREMHAQEEAATALDRLKHFGGNLLEGVVQGGVMEPEATSRSREVQNAILLHRRTSPVVFDWIYRRLRRDHEEQMNVGAEAMVAQVDTQRKK